MNKPILVGAVVYDPKVVLIWDIIKGYFAEQGCPMDTVFYTNYEVQTEDLVSGRLDLAWQSPLAWLDTVRQAGNRARAVAMRDTDRDRVSHLVVAKSGPVHALSDLRGRKLGLGAWDSPQAHLIPRGLVRQAGLDPDADLDCRRFDLLVGKHGDHVGGEHDAFEALHAGEVDACAMLDLNHEAWVADGTLDDACFEILATTPRFDHCVFATLDGALVPEREKAWLDALFAMDYGNPAHREMMDMEGLKAWVPGRVSGFDALSAAVAAERFFDRREAGAWA